MALASGQLTTFGVVNFEGDLYNVTPTDTKLLSILGGLYGGETVGTVVWSWQEHDLRDAAQTGALEGADAPSGTGRTRTNVKNVLQIIHEVVEVSDTKQATSQMVQDIGSAHTGVSSAGQGNPVRSEIDWQLDVRLKEIARDCEFTILNGLFTEPTDNNSERQTKGLIEAISTNHTDVASGSVNVTGEDSNDLIDDTSTAFADDDKVQFTALTGGDDLEINRTYYVVNKETNGFQLADSLGGAALDFGADIEATSTIELVEDLTSTFVLDLMQDIYDNGGIMEEETATIIAGSWNKRQLTEAFLSASTNGFRQDNRNVGGVNLETFDTDFGRINVMLNRHTPGNTVVVSSLEQLRLKWLAQEKGTFYMEELARAGLARRFQLAGEWGLQFGNELTHGKISGLSTR